MLKKILLLSILFSGLIMANRLENETSPYLLQHKENPVKWYPWCEEVFERAKKENKLVFLSIGYSTCHWCHVMAHESFEDDEVAKVLNKDYISIKMDREQYPHIDGFYQKAYRFMSGQGGGWPLSIIMTADKEPFFAATYIPKYASYGSKGFIEILDYFSDFDRGKLAEEGKRVLSHINKSEDLQPVKNGYDKEMLKTIVKQYKSMYDPVNKGFGERPKFPQFVNIILLLKIYGINKDKSALSMATDALKAMAKGGIFDQVEGGFYRYSVDEKWMIPHFEKMLYTNAEALEAYTLAYMITKDELFKEVIDRTIEQVDAVFMEDGVYMSASNADSKNEYAESEEGYYFVYDYSDTHDLLVQNGIEADDAKKSLNYLGITEDGNFEMGLSNPHIKGAKKPDKLGDTIKLLKMMRDKREYPSIDNKINTAWNALYLRGRLIASRVDERFLESTLSSLDALTELVYRDGVLYHQTIKGKTPVQEAILEDYSFLAAALFEAYQITLDEKYFTLYEKLLKRSIELFYKDGRWLESNDGFKTYADIEDAGYASALGIHFNNLILYATMEGELKIYDMVRSSMEYFTYKLNRYPARFPNSSLASVYFQIEPIFIKSRKENLILFDAEDFSYPFVYKKSYEADEYLACKIKSCFSYSKDLQEVKKDIDSLVVK